MKDCEKKIYIPYTYRDSLLLGVMGKRITVENLCEIHKEGRLSGDRVGIKYVEEFKTTCDVPFLNSTAKECTSWQHYHCEFKSFKKVSFSTIDSYQGVGRPNFVGGERMSNNLGGDYWEVTILIESHSVKGVLIQSYVEIVDYSIMDPYTFSYPEIRLTVEDRLKPSNYLYYTLL